jgi:hypothetical protein
MTTFADAGTNEDGIVMKEAAFRGRKLMGSTLVLPDGFCGKLLYNAMFLVTLCFFLCSGFITLLCFFSVGLG